MWILHADHKSNLNQRRRTLIVAGNTHAKALEIVPPRGAKNAWSASLRASVSVVMLLMSIKMVLTSAYVKKGENFSNRFKIRRWGSNDR